MKNIAIGKTFGNNVKDMIDEIIMAKMKEGNEIAKVEGTETPTIEVTKLVEQKLQKDFMKNKIRDRGKTR